MRTEIITAGKGVSDMSCEDTDITDQADFMRMPEKLQHKSK
jgi:hypothetical protein